jgi:hypothetical protein
MKRERAQCRKFLVTKRSAVANPGDRREISSGEAARAMIERATEPRDRNDQERGGGRAKKRPAIGPATIPSHHLNIP